MASTGLPVSKRESFMQLVLTAVQYFLVHGEIWYCYDRKKTEELLGGGPEIIIGNYKWCCSMLMTMKPDEYVCWYTVFVHLPSFICTGKYVVWFIIINYKFSVSLKLSFWWLTLSSISVPAMQCNAQTRNDWYSWQPVMASVMQPTLKLRLAAHHTGHLILVLKG
jgi:hypothetical protein